MHKWADGFFFIIHNRAEYFNSDNPFPGQKGSFIDQAISISPLKRCTVSTPKTPKRGTPSHSPNIRNCGILFTSSCQGCLRDNLRLSTRHSRNPKKHGILIIASSFNRPGGTERHGNRYYETLPSRQIPW